MMGSNDKPQEQFFYSFNILKIELDGQTYDLNPEVSGNYASVQLNDFEQGLHQIKITLIRP